MIDGIDENSARQMTEDEKQWVRRLRRVMAACPSTLELMTHGDACLFVLDRKLARGPIHDGFAGSRGVILDHIQCTCLVHGVSG